MIPSHFFPIHLSPFWGLPLVIPNPDGSYPQPINKSRKNISPKRVAKRRAKKKRK